MKTYFGNLTCLLAFLTGVIIIMVECGDYGSVKCVNGAWSPDAKIIGFGLSCPLPLDGKTKSKGKSAQCVLKKIGSYDGTTVKTDVIAPELCGIFPDADISKSCKQTIQNCLKDEKKFFKDKKSDPDFKTWASTYECLETWASEACKK